MAPTHPDLVLLSAVALIGIGAVVALQVARPQTEYPAGTPEAVVQEFLRATSVGDPVALDLLDPGLGCTAWDVENAWMPRDLRVDLLDADVTGTAARVRVEVVEGGGDDLFGGYERSESFTLERVGADWVVTEMSWPLWCEGSNR